MVHPKTLNTKEDILKNVGNQTVDGHEAYFGNVISYIKII